MKEFSKKGLRAKVLAEPLAELFTLDAIKWNISQHIRSSISIHRPAYRKRISSGSGHEGEGELPK